MMAMTMPFSLQDSTDLHRFSVGDSIQFYLKFDGLPEIIYEAFRGPAFLRYTLSKNSEYA